MELKRSGIDQPHGGVSIVRGIRPLSPSPGTTATHLPARTMQTLYLIEYPLEQEGSLPCWWSTTDCQRAGKMSPIAGGNYEPPDL